MSMLRCLPSITGKHRYAMMDQSHLCATPKVRSIVHFYWLYEYFCSVCNLSENKLVQWRGTMSRNVVPTGNVHHWHTNVHTICKSLSHCFVIGSEQKASSYSSSPETKTTCGGKSRIFLKNSTCQWLGSFPWTEDLTITYTLVCAIIQWICKELMNLQDNRWHDTLQIPISIFARSLCYESPFTKHKDFMSLQLILRGCFGTSFLHWPGKPLFPLQTALISDLCIPSCSCANTVHQV